MAGGGDNRTEKPTPRRLQKAREKGQVARSREVPSAAVLAGSLLVLGLVGQEFLAALQRHMGTFLLQKAPEDITASFVLRLIHIAVAQIGPSMGAVMIAAVAFSLAGNFWQSGVVLSWEALRLNPAKLNPKSGLSRIFSKNGLVELLKSLLMMTVVGYLCYRVLSEYSPLYPRLVLMDTRQLLYWTTTISSKIFLRVAVFVAVLACLDYAFQRYRFREQLKMTKQEVRDEFKEMEGDPQIRGRIRRIQRDMARRRMMADVPTADIVITNPTHYAVALSYKMETMDAPKLVAKGVGFLALRIRELAQNSQVPIVENRLLAQTLYKTVEIGDTIPASLYQAVAEILAYIYKARQAWRR